MLKEVMQSNRVFAIPLLVVLVLGLIFMTAILPLVKMDAKDIPLGIVVLDQEVGSQDLANGIVENAPDTFAFYTYDSEQELEQALEGRKIYGALVFPRSFSEKLQSLTSDSPKKATVQLFINEGANPTMAQLVQTSLTNMVTMINQQMSGQIVSKLEESQAALKERIEPILVEAGTDSPLGQIEAMISPIQPDMLFDLANPIEAEIKTVHPSGQLGNAPIAYLITAWFTSLIGAVILYLVGQHRPKASKQAKLKWQVLQTILPFVYGIFAGYIATWYSTWLLGFEFDHFHRVAWYLAFCILAFTFMILATISWLRLPSIVIFVILMFFSMAAIQMAPEMMPSFYQDYIISWLPLRIYADGLRDLLFYSHQIINDYSRPLLWIFIASFLLLWLKHLLDLKKLD